MKLENVIYMALIVVACFLNGRNQHNIDDRAPASTNNQSVVVNMAMSAGY